jgi:hypothetical protein
MARAAAHAIEVALRSHDEAAIKTLLEKLSN